MRGETVGFRKWAEQPPSPTSRVGDWRRRKNEKWNNWDQTTRGEKMPQKRKLPERTGFDPPDKLNRTKSRSLEKLEPDKLDRTGSERFEKCW